MIKDMEILKIEYLNTGRYSFALIDEDKKVFVNLPSASVFPISTVSPFLDFITSDGLKALLLILFYTKPKLAVTLAFNFSLEIVFIADKTEHDPCLSRCISNMKSK